MRTCPPKRESRIVAMKNILRPAQIDGEGRGRREGGFTLLEVLVSLGILSAVLVLCYQVMAGAVAASDRSERWTTATLLGEELLRDAVETYPEIQETEGAFPAPYDRYSWRMVVQQAVHPDAREVHVTVVFRAEGDEESVTLSGIAAR
jgi:prepilin-type N-terminal cleavage/methylation domain-containing protein